MPLANPTTDASIQTSDVTTNNVSTTKHGFAPKITDTAAFLKGDGTWASPSAGAAGSDTQVQFNDGGSALGGDSGLTYAKSTDTLTVLGNIELGNATANTLSASGGVLSIEGTALLKNGGALGTPSSGTLTNCTGTADGLTAGDVTRNHAVYAGASPPTVDVGAFIISKTGIDLKTAGTTTIFTVPASRTAICLGAWAIVTSVTGAGAGTQTFKIQESGASQVMTANAASASGTPAVGKYYGEATAAATGQYTACAAGNNVQIVVATSHAGSTAVTGTVFAQMLYTA